MSDLISREDAIDAMIMLGVKRAAAVLESLPSAEPIELTVKVENQHYGYSPYAFEFMGNCENCNETVRLGEKFCHECGAKLEWK